MRHIKNFVLVFLLAGFANMASAASLSLVPSYPDLVTFDANYTYDYVDSGNPNKLGGTLTVDGGLLALNPDGNGNIGVTGGSYLLTANFGLDGIFIDGTVAVTGTTADTDFQSGTIVTGDLLDFGFYGIDQAGAIEFTFDNIFGDMAAFGTEGGIIISMTDMLFGFNPFAGQWDTTGTNDPTFWQRDFAGIADVDTFVPVPAAIWLFGSGLLSLFALGRIKRTS